MNTTESGATAVGAPMSLARLQQELDFYFSPGGSLCGLSKTPEGAALITAFLEGNGLRFEGPEKFAIFLEKTHLQDRISHFCDGALTALRMSMAGRVY